MSKSKSSVTIKVLLMLVMIFLGYVIKLIYPELFSVRFWVDNKEILMGLKSNAGNWFVVVYACAFFVSVCTPLPVAAIFTILSGFLFGALNGLVLVVLCSSVAALVTFIITRNMIREDLLIQYEKEIAFLDKVVGEGSLFGHMSVRLIPVMPFFLTNALLSVTKISKVSFYFSTLVGMLLFQIVLVNAGVQLSRVNDLTDLINTYFLVSVGAIGLIPIIMSFCLKTNKL